MSEDNLLEIIKHLKAANNLHIIAQHPTELQNLCPEITIDSMQEYDLSYYTILAEVALQLRRQNLNPHLVRSITDELCGLSTPTRDLARWHHNMIISNGLKTREQYREKIITLSKSHKLLIIGTDHELLYRFSSTENIEVIFIGNKTAESLDHLPQDRQILQQDPSIWHRIYDPELPPRGIEIIDCSSREQAAQTIKRLVEMPQIIAIADLQLLQRLEIIIPDFSYHRPVHLDPDVYLLAHVLDEHPKNQHDFLEQHLTLYLESEYKGAELSLVGQGFWQDYRTIIGNLNISSYQEYKEIFLLLSKNISYNNKPYAAVQAISPCNIHKREANNVVISSDKNIIFQQLLRAQNITIIHMNGNEEPPWLLQLRALISPKEPYAHPMINQVITHNSAANPPQDARPRTLSATMLEMLMRDPYAFYVRYILKVKPSLVDSEVMDFGIFVHNTLAKYTKQGLDNLELLLEYGAEELSGYEHRPQARVLWWPRFQAIATHFVAEEKKRRDQIVQVECEVQYKLAIADHIIAVTCDRVEHLKDGTIAIIEYKTGSLPTNQDIKLGRSPQLLLQGLVVQTVLEKDISELSYWQLQADGIIKRSIADLSEALPEAQQGITHVLQEYPTLIFKPTAHYKNYQHASRLKEVFGF